MISKSQPGRDVVVPADLDAGQDRCDDVVAEGEERADGAGRVGRYMPSGGVSRATAATPVLSGHFPHHVGGVLVPPQALEPGMAQPPVRRPFGETDLGDEPGFHPVHPRPGQATDGFEGRLRSLIGRQGRVQAGQGAPIEAGAHLAGVSQLAVAVVVAQQQRAEPGAGSPRVGVAADDELLRVLALELQPVPGAPGPVGRVGPLGDDPFPALDAGLPPVRPAPARRAPSGDCARQRIARRRRGVRTRASRPSATGRSREPILTRNPSPGGP